MRLAPGLGLTVAAIVVLLAVAACGKSAIPTLVEQPRFADGEAIAVLKQWLINVGCIGLLLRRRRVARRLPGRREQVRLIHLFRNTVR